MKTSKTKVDKELSLLLFIRGLSADSIQRIAAFVDNVAHVALARRYETCLQKRAVDLGFNLFAIISDLYYRENFHSDILKALIDPNGKHDAQETYLHVFLRFLNLNGASINLSDYGNAQVVREEGKVDLLIKDDTSKKAIIIENKINSAGDMPRQIPRYLAYVKSLGYSCDAVIYLRLSGYSLPETAGWTDDERKTVKRLLTVVSAYDEKDNDLLNGWINKCKDISENQDAKHILCQYGALITKLGGNVMNKPIMKEFYDKMLEGDNLKTAQSLKSMLDDLVLYRVERIIDEFKSDLHPFHKIANWANNDAYFTNCFWGDAHLGIDVGVEPDSYTFSFWDRNDEDGKKKHAQSALEKMKCIDQYRAEGGEFKKVFAFPAEENELYQHIRSFKTRLSKVMPETTAAG